MIRNCIAVLLALAGCFFLAAQPVKAQELLLGMSAAFTGPSRGLGIELYRGSAAYFAKVNAEGGVHGRAIRIAAMDDGYDPIPAIENTLELVRNQNVLALFNYVGTPTVTRVLPLIKSFTHRKVLLFFPFTGAQPQREEPYSRYVFNLRASYRQETSELVDAFVRLGRERVAVFYQVDAYGRSGWDGVRRALARYDLPLVGEATYRRGSEFDVSMAEQVEIISNSNPDAVISVGSYAACAAFIRDARNAGLDVPIANLSFVGSENLLSLLQKAEQEGGRSYSRNLINTQVVPSYEDLSLPAVREYRRLMDEVNPAPPAGVADPGYAPLIYSFASFEGFLNAKVMTRVLRELGKEPYSADIATAANSIHSFNIGIDVSVSFTANRQGMNKVYFTTVEEGAFVPVRDWSRWRQ